MFASMSFFNSDIVQNEMKMIQEIQEKIYSQVWAFPAMNHDDKVKHVAELKELLNKQQILYARLSLSDDPDAKKMKENIDASAKECGFPQTVDMGNVFTNMFNAVDAMEKQLKKRS